MYITDWAGWCLGTFALFRRTLGSLMYICTYHQLLHIKLSRVPDLCMLRQVACSTEGLIPAPPRLKRDIDKRVAI